MRSGYRERKAGGRPQPSAPSSRDQDTPRGKVRGQVCWRFLRPDEQHRGGGALNEIGGDAAEPGSPTEGVGPGLLESITPKTLICDHANDKASGPWFLTSGIGI